MQAGPQCAVCQNCQRLTSACFLGSVGQRPLAGFFAARYWRIAFDSQRTKPSSSRTGIFRFGFSATNSGFCCSPFVRSTIRGSNSMPRWCAAAITLMAFGEGGKTYVCIDKNTAPGRFKYTVNVHDAGKPLAPLDPFVDNG